MSVSQSGIRSKIIFNHSTVVVNFFSTTCASLWKSISQHNNGRYLGNAVSAEGRETFVPLAKAWLWPTHGDVMFVCWNQRFFRFS